MEYKHSKNQVYLINFHLVWCTKRRKKVLRGQIKERLREIIMGVLEDFRADCFALEIMPDHLHLFISTPPQLHTHKLVKQIKGRSSRILREEFPELLKIPSLWTNSYFISTAGNVSRQTIQKYIEAQSKK